MEPDINKDPPEFQFQLDKPYRYRPSLNKAIVVGNKLVDLDGTQLQFFDVIDHTFIRSV